MANLTEAQWEKAAQEAGVSVDILKSAMSASEPETQQKVVNMATVQESLVEARTDVTPALSVDDDGLIAVGDPSLVQNEAHEYTVHYTGVYDDMMPTKPQSWVATTDGRGSFEMKMKAKRVSPFVRNKIERHATIVQYAFLQVRKEREIADLSFADLIYNAATIAENIEDAVRAIVVTVLDIAEDLADYIDQNEYSRLYAEVVENNPEFFQRDSEHN